jgi:type VI secretion system protein ImpA
MATVIEVDRLLDDVAPGQPCGGDLEYDPDFSALDRAATTVPEQVMGEDVIPGKEPDWADVRRRALDLFSRTKDLRVAVTLARALLKTDGLIGFRDGLDLLARLVAGRWDGVYPRLDPDDGLDPTARVNILASLCDPETFLREVRDAPVIVSRTFGTICYRDIALAVGELKPAAAEKTAKAAELSQINAAFHDADAAAVQATTDVVRDALARVVSLETALTTHVGVRHAADFAPLSSLLESINRFLSSQLTELGLSGDGSAEPPLVGNGQAPPAESATVPNGTLHSRAGGEISSREDVIRLLDGICSYYQRTEPASPVPLLLRRARRLVPMQFVDVIRDLAPDALPTIEMLGGTDTAGEGN